MQLLQNTRRRASLPIHDVGKMSGADTGSTGNLILTEPMSVHPAPHNFPIHTSTLRGRNLHRSLQGRLDRAWTFTPIFPRPRDTWDM